jgi:LytS/YehU family sensor histidine kinase
VENIDRKLELWVFAVLATGGLPCAVKGVNYWQRQLRVQLEEQRLRTELELLKSQPQPPFLFSTLRTLHALTTQKSPESPAAVLHLSALLRYMLYESPQAAVPLADEVDMMRNYVALERLRLGAGIDVSLNFSEPLELHAVAPLLLPFVENAFRHATQPALECSWVSIDLVAKPHCLAFKVSSSYPNVGPEVAAADLGSIRERLVRLYPNQHEMRVMTEPDTLVVLHLRLTPAKPALVPVSPAQLLSADS